MRKILFFVSLLFTSLFALDISQIDPSTLTSEQLKAYNAYVSSSSSNALQSSKVQQPTIQPLYNSTTTKPPLPQKDLDLSAPPEMPNTPSMATKNNDTPFSTPLDYKTNETIFKSVQAQKVQKVKYELQKFGDSLFNNNNSVNPYTIPTSENYVLNNGDKISAHIYGQQSINLELLIDRNGNTEIQNIGVLKIGGLKYIHAKKLIEEQLQKAYPQSTFVLDIAYYNTVQVLLTGEVKAPGLYNLPSFATVKDLLMVANGINTNGSYRNILVKRNGQTVEQFDTYKLLISGQHDTPTLLQNGDVVTVEKAQKELKLIGEISTPAKYELKNNETFKQLFSYAGGFTYNANKNVLKLTRFTNNEKIKVYTLSYEKLLKMTPENGDTLEVFSLASSLNKMVTLKGNIVQEGDREIPEDNKLSSLLTKEIDIYGKNYFFLENTAFDLGMIKRKKVDGNYEILTFKVNDILEKKQEILLKESDEISIPNKLQVGENPYIHVEGIVVKNAGRYQYFDNMDIQSLFKNIQFKTEISFNDNNVIMPLDVNTSDTNLLLP